MSFHPQADNMPQIRLHWAPDLACTMKALVIIVVLIACHSTLFLENNEGARRWRRK